MVKKKEKRERFERLATHRTNEVLRKLRILGHCANRSAYDYTEEEVAKIFLEIEREVKEIKAKFTYPRSSREFRL